MEGHLTVVGVYHKFLSLGCTRVSSKEPSSIGIPVITSFPWLPDRPTASLVRNKITTHILLETFNLIVNMMTPIPRFPVDHSICDVHLSGRKKPSKDEHFLQICTKSLTKIITTNLHTSLCNIPLLVLRYSRRNFPQHYSARATIDRNTKKVGITFPRHSVALHFASVFYI